MKNNFQLKNLFLSFSASTVFGFCVMCLFWLITGMKYNLFVCFKVFIPVFACAFALLMIMTFSAAVSGGIKRRKIDLYRRKYGCSDDYYKVVIKYLGGNTEKFSASKLLFLASAYAQGERCTDCLNIIGRIDFTELNAAEQNEYFNIMLYNSLINGSFETAREIYKKSVHYFERAMLSKNNAHIMHTLGMYFYAEEQLAKAEHYFISAKAAAHDCVLKGDCDLYLGLCYLKTGRREYAKASAINASKQIKEKRQMINLRKLMIMVEKSYGAQSAV